MVTAWATAHSDALKLKIPAKFDPNAPATEYERYFYDAIWPGYVPASRLKRYG
jgi:hypothetical protein